jgi:hypothetical protein
VVQRKRNPLTLEKEPKIEILVPPVWLGPIEDLTLSPHWKHAAAKLNATLAVRLTLIPGLATIKGL